MSFEFTEAELSNLPADQTRAVLNGLLLASVTGPEVGEDDVQRYQAAVAALPYKIDQALVDATLADGQRRYSGAEPSDYGVWIRDVAALLPDAGLREKLIVAMGHVSANDWAHRDDPSVLGAAVRAFAIDEGRLAEIYQIFAIQAPSEA